MGMTDTLLEKNSNNKLKKFTHSETLRNITLTLQVSYTKYDPAEFNNASEFLGDGINSLQYDV